MNQHIEDANILAQKNSFSWPQKFILRLEELERNTAIIWIIQFLKHSIESSVYEEKEEWLKLLIHLERIASGKIHSDSNELARKSKTIFNMPPARNKFLTLISHVYAAESVFLNKNFDSYHKRLIILVAHMNNYENRLNREMEKLMEIYSEMVS